MNLLMKTVVKIITHPDYKGDYGTISHIYRVKKQLYYIVDIIPLNVRVQVKPSHVRGTVNEGETLSKSIPLQRLNEKPQIKQETAKFCKGDNVIVIKGIGKDEIRGTVKNVMSVQGEIYCVFDGHMITQNRLGLVKRSVDSKKLLKKPVVNLETKLPESPKKPRTKFIIGQKVIVPKYISKNNTEDTIGEIEDISFKSNNSIYYKVNGINYIEGVIIEVSVRQLEEMLFLKQYDEMVDDLDNANLLTEVGSKSNVGYFQTDYHRQNYEDLIKSPQHKTRKCIKCGIEFISKHFGNRKCSVCVANNNYAYKMEHVHSLPATIIQNGI